MTSPVGNTLAVFAFRADKQQQLVQAQVVSSAVETAKQIAQSNAAQAASSGVVNITV